MEIAPISEIDMVIRLCLGFIAGGIIGFERSSRHQVAGLRTHILICLGATLLTLLSIRLPLEFSPLKTSDPGRIAAQVVSGIGFLGAGAIIRLGNNVKGLTTATSLWLIAAIGMAIGAGMFLAAAIAEALSLIALILLERIERRVFPGIRNKILELHYKSGINPDTEAVLNVLKGFKIGCQTMDVDQGNHKGKAAKLSFMVGIPETADISALARAFKSADTVERVEIKEKI